MLSNTKMCGLVLQIGERAFSSSAVCAFKGNKHWSPKFKKLRAMKVIKVDLPSFDPETSTPTNEEIRARMKEKGLVPPRPWQEKPIFIGNTTGIFEPYVPPEGDGKISVISLGGAKQSLVKIGKKGASMLAVRKIHSYDEDFDAGSFAEEAQEIYIKMHKALAAKDEDALHELATEHAFPSVTANLGKTRIRWNFIKSLEPPTVVHARVTNVISDDNMFAQVTVRFHTQQTLAVYDRFGRLMHGSELVVKDVLEYVVFEKHISNQYGVWRIHDKIIPDWMPPKEATFRTFLKHVEEVPEELVSEMKQSSDVTA